MPEDGRGVDGWTGFKRMFLGNEDGTPRSAKADKRDADSRQWYLETCANTDGIAPTTMADFCRFDKTQFAGIDYTKLCRAHIATYETHLDEIDDEAGLTDDEQNENVPGSARRGVRSELDEEVANNNAQFMDFARMFGMEGDMSNMMREMQAKANMMRHFSETL